MHENRVRIRHSHLELNSSLLAVPSKHSASGLHSPSFSPILTYEYYNRTTSIKDDWSAIVQPSISQKKLNGVRTSSLNSLNSFSLNLNDFTNDYPFMRHLHSTSASIWSLEDPILKHLNPHFDDNNKGKMFNSVILPQEPKQIVFGLYKDSHWKFSCPGLFQLKEDFDSLSFNNIISHSKEIKVVTKDCQLDNVSKRSGALSPTTQAITKNCRRKCEEWLKEVTILEN